MTALLILFAAAAAAVTGCELPPGTLPRTITEGFAIQVQNPEFPVIHNRLMNLWEAGGGDKHLFLAPAGNSSDALTLVDGVITLATVVPTIRAVINGEYTPEDNTTKMFMTERGDPRAVYDVAYGCNPDTDEVQTELVLSARGSEPGGHICVRSTSGERHEFRYSPPENPTDDPARPCMSVRLAVVHP
ncbi:hypothetical protein MCOR27_004112 [Pyricularia oryzae]|uniref:DUF7909 domain-containing protein n=2 Tax=Pyricularia TaxID=48558 RepID=A0ABQ8NY55_PYRGI|nr:hypothetical protein MCOR01_009320 [Pyricularia oryzae]KAI6303800.1 hypothetical protein MCOR33_001152 [Pyricularia grisea]KAH9437425.1 hypothetical protein MCOR02_001082 [Pyricularia oryzae]KAI6259460.1 hypothetical protein MCOR19_004197 [Pyricularia oryzae]KAI6280471.1 hypothetical protein MCOR26_003711 [Pyricularia oryzae]